MPLTDLRVRSAKPDVKPFKLADEKGLYLLVNLKGKYWRFDYRFSGKRKTLALGVYPTVTLAEAREALLNARKSLAANVDPSAQKKALKSAGGDLESFEFVAREWYSKYVPVWSPSHADKILRRFERDIFPWIGKRPVREITPPELLAVLRRIEGRGRLETAHRAKQSSGQVFQYAVATGRAERDITQDLKRALPPTRVRHHASITDPKQIGALLRAINGYEGSFITKSALRLAPHVFVRPGELRKAEWREIDFENAEWRIPAERMKMREVHIVPLSSHVVEILRELHPLTGSGKYLFPGPRTSSRPMSENTVNAALRRMGYTRDEMTGHGFRSMASTLLNEQGWNRDAIERQLAHAERDAVRAAYNYAEHLPERRRMMNSWSTYLVGLCNGAEVINLHNVQRA